MKDNSKKTGDQREPLKTEYPLCEKDEQAWQLDNTRKLQEKALKLWRALKKKKPK